MQAFEIVKVLGAGSFGRALLCRDEKKALVVVKEVLVKDPAALVEAESEAQLLQRHSHSNIVHYIASFADAGRRKFYLVMEYADGGDLAGAVARRREKRSHWTEAEAMLIFVQLLLAVRHVHARRIVHRDIKAANVFLTRDGVVKLGDFGVSKALEVKNDVTELAKTQVGTPYYLSPEIFEGKTYGRKSDIWSLGVLDYEVLALKMPFEAPSLAALCRKVTSGTAPPAQPLQRYSADARALLTSLLRTSPRQRPSADDLLKQPYVRSHIAKTLSQTTEGGALALSTDALVKKEAGRPRRQPRAAPLPKQEEERARMQQRRVEVLRAKEKARRAEREKTEAAQKRLNKRPEWRVEVDSHLQEQQEEEDDSPRLEASMKEEDEDEDYSSDSTEDDEGAHLEKLCFEDARGSRDEAKNEAEPTVAPFPKELGEEYERAVEDRIRQLPVVAAGRRRRPSQPSAEDQFWQNRQLVEQARARDSERPRDIERPREPRQRNNPAPRSVPEEPAKKGTMEDFFFEETEARPTTAARNAEAARRQFHENRVKATEMARRHRDEQNNNHEKRQATPDESGGRGVLSAGRVRDIAVERRESERAAHVLALEVERARLREMRHQIETHDPKVILEFDMRSGPAAQRNKRPPRLARLRASEAAAETKEEEEHQQLARVDAAAPPPRPPRNRGTKNQGGGANQGGAASAAALMSVASAAAGVDAAPPTADDDDDDADVEEGKAGEPRRRRRRRWNDQEEASEEPEKNNADVVARRPSSHEGPGDGSGRFVGALDDMWHAVARAQAALPRRLSRRRPSLERRRPPKDGVAALNAALQSALDDVDANGDASPKSDDDV